MEPAHNTDIGIVRFSPESGMASRIYNQDELAKLLSERHPVGFWNDFECIQACIKSRTGIGHHIPIHFVMDSQNLASDQVLYEYQRVGSQIKQKLLQRAKTKIPLKDLNQ